MASVPARPSYGVVPRLAKSAASWGCRSRKVPWSCISSGISHSSRVFISPEPLGSFDKIDLFKILASCRNPSLPALLDASAALCQRSASTLHTISSAYRPRTRHRRARHCSAAAACCQHYFCYRPVPTAFPVFLAQRNFDKIGFFKILCIVSQLFIASTHLTPTLSINTAYCQ